MTRLSVVAAGRHLRDVDGAPIALAGISFLGSRYAVYTRGPFGWTVGARSFRPGSLWPPRKRLFWLA